MSGILIRLGYYRTSNGPDLAKIEASEQLVSHAFPNTSGSDLIVYAAAAYVGNWLSPAVIRYGAWAASSSSAAPGALLGRTEETSPTVNYVDAAGGQLRTANFETPFLLKAGDVIAAGAGSRGNASGIAMFQASSISQPNESFYRRSITGNSLIAAGGEQTNQGQLAIVINTEANVAPTAPTATTPASGIGTDLKPVIAGTFNDANETLNSGAKWDYPTQARIEVRDGTTVIWDYTYTTTSDERTNRRTVRRYAGPALNYYKTYSYRIHHRDRGDKWSSAASSWIYFSVKHNNHDPNTPVYVSGLGTKDGDRTITVAYNFSDPDVPLLPDGTAYEGFYQKQIVIRRVSDNALIWDSGAVATTGAEKGAFRSQTTYSLPAFDVQYRWYERHYDRAGASSGYATGTIIARSGGSVDMPSAPAGRVTNLANPGNFVAVYRNTGSTSATAIRVGVFNENETLLSQRDRTVTVSPGGGFNLAWADLWTPSGYGFQEGRTYNLAAKALVNGIWTDWSPFQTIVTNAAPNTPTLYGPADGAVASYLYTTSVRVTDPDQPPSTTVVTAEYYDADTDALIGTLTVPWLPASGGTLRNVFGITPSSLITGYRNVKWRMQASDGFLTSAWSPMWAFSWAAVPAVTITSPTGPTVTTRQPTFNWTSTGQLFWRVQGHDQDGELVYDTTVISGGDQSITIGADYYWIGSERWNNGETFIWTVMVQDSSTLWGSSAPLELTLAYTPPASLSIIGAIAAALPGVKGTHYGLIVWAPTTYTEAEFLGYVLDRVEIDGPAGSPNPRTYRPDHARIGGAADRSIFDFDMTPGQWYRWGVWQEIQQGIDVITSDPTYVELMIDFHGTLLHMPSDPLNNYVWLQYGAMGGRYEVSRDHSMAITSETDINGDVHNYITGKPTVNPSGAYTFIGNDGLTAMQQLDTLHRMFAYQNPKISPDGRPHGLCWREGRGGRTGRQYVMLANWSDSGTMGGTQSVELEFIPNRNGGDV